MRWIVYYADGSTFSDRDGSAFEAPSVGMQCIVQAADNVKGFSIGHGKDYAYWKENGWNVCDWGGLFDYLMLYRGPKAVLFGRSIRTDDYYRILSRASEAGLGG